MPTLISETDVRLERVDMLRRIILPRSTGADGFIIPPPRSPGLHLSGLLKYVAYKSRITARLTEIADEEHPWRWALGQAFEEFAVSLWPDIIWQPYECASPVIMNCDGIMTCVIQDGVQDGVQDEGMQSAFVICEFKHNRAKKYSGPELIRRKWLWMQQGLGYCLGYGTRYVEWHVMSTMEFPDPVYTKYLVRFDETELDGMRRMIGMNRDKAIEEGYAE